MKAKLKATLAEPRLLGAPDTGATNNQVATAMHNSEETVRNQLNTLYRKINVSNRTRAVSGSGITSLLWPHYTSLLSRHLLNFADAN